MPERVPDAFGFTQKQLFSTTELEEIDRADLVTAAAFSECGNHIAVGDKGGRIWVYSTKEGKNRCKPRSHVNPASNQMDYKDGSEKEDDADMRGYTDFDFYGQFQSHETEFDYLKSLEIEEKINVIQWCPRVCNALTLLAANDKCIKLWKIFEKPIIKPSFRLFDETNGAPMVDLDELPIPKLDSSEILTAAIPRRTYNQAHQYHINSLTLCSDKECFISADDLRINLWSLESQHETFVICDLKPENMEDLSVVIKHVQFHPTHCNILSYCTSRGELVLCDLRANSIVRKPSKLFKQTEKQRDFFSDITEQLLSSSFCLSDPNKAFARDYKTVKVWDLRTEREPFRTVEIPGLGKENLESLYENERLFDSFDVTSAATTKHFATGFYNGVLLCNWETGEKQMVRVGSDGSRPSPSFPSTSKMEVDFSGSPNGSNASPTLGAGPDANRPWVTAGVHHLAFSPSPNGVETLLATQAAEVAVYARQPQQNSSSDPK